MTGPSAKPHITSLPLYETGAASGQGHGPVVKLSSNESAFGPSPSAVRAYHAMASDLYRYPEAGDGSLRRSIAGEYGLASDRIICSNGSDHIIYLLLAAYAGAGDEVVVTQYGFFRNTLSVRACGATPVLTPEPDHTASVDAMLAAVTERTTVVLLANPNNPTGTCIGRSELERLARGLPAGILLIIDSAYAEYVASDDYSAGADLADAAEYVVMTRTFSKAYGLAGLRVGWAYGSAPIVDAYRRAQLPYPVSQAAQAAAEAAVRDRDHLARVVEQTAEGRMWVRARLESLGLAVLPSVANFNTCRVGDPGSGRAAAAVAFLGSRNIFVRPQVAAGLPDHVRITVGLPHENEAVVDGLAAFLDGNAP